MGRRAEDPSLASCTGRFGFRWMGDDRPLVNLFACAVRINFLQSGTVERSDRPGMKQPFRYGVEGPVIVLRLGPDSIDGVVVGSSVL